MEVAQIGQYVSTEDFTGQPKTGDHGLGGRQRWTGIADPKKVLSLAVVGGVVFRGHARFRSV